MDGIRVATEEQVGRVRSEADLGPSSVVWAMGEDLAVVKTVVEIDPVFFTPKSSIERRLLFIWGLENMLRGNGVDAYYFNIPDGDTQWKHVVETHGAKSISVGPELRYKKVLLPAEKEA